MLPQRGGRDRVPGGARHSQMSAVSGFAPGLGFSISCQLTEFIYPGSLPVVLLGSTTGCRIPSRSIHSFLKCLFLFTGGATYPFKDASFSPPAATLTEILLGEVSHHPMDRS